MIDPKEEARIRLDERKRIIADGCIHTRKAKVLGEMRPDIRAWQEAQGEWFDDAICEIVSEYAAWRDAQPVPEVSQSEAAPYISPIPAAPALNYRNRVDGVPVVERMHLWPTDDGVRPCDPRCCRECERERSWKEGQTRGV